MNIRKFHRKSHILGEFIDFLKFLFLMINF